MPLVLKQVAAALTPLAGENALYPKSDDLWYTKNSAGTESLVGPAALVAAMSTGYRGTVANTTIPNATWTAINIQGATDHAHATAFTRSGDIVTIVNAGVYRLHAFVYWNTASANCRQILQIETWTGTDPGVGAATPIAAQEMLGTSTHYNGMNLETQRSFAAGAKVRLIAYQTQGSSNTTAATLTNQVHQLNLTRLT